MELDEFIKQSLLGIANGIKGAQAELGQSSGQARVNAGGIEISMQDDINFDVAVTVVQQEGANATGDGGIRVLGIGGAGFKGELKTEHNHSSVTRLRFKIPMFFPVG